MAWPDKLRTDYLPVGARPWVLMGHCRYRKQEKKELILVSKASGLGVENSERAGWRRTTRWTAENLRLASRQG